MRWSISKIIYYSHHGQNRSVDFNSRGVTIITGCSHTGKTGILNTLDYCLGSSNCDIPYFVKKRCAAVAVKFTNETDEIFIARDISSNSDSNTMYFHKSNFIGIPKKYADLSGKMHRDAARNLLEQSFGIENIPQEGFKDNRVSIRQATAFMFLSKEVIDSSAHLFHGTWDRHKSRHLVGAMPYFLGAITLKDVHAEYTIEKLRTEIKQEQRKGSRFLDLQTNALKKGRSLLAESKSAGITGIDVSSLTESDIISHLRRCRSWQPGEVLTNEEGDDKYLTLQRQKQDIILQIRQLNKDMRAVKEYMKAADGFKDTMQEQHEKVQLISLFNDIGQASACPVCASPLSTAKNMQSLLEKLLPKLASELHSVKSHIPKVLDYSKDIDNKKEELKKHQDQIEQELTGIVAEMESVKIIQDFNLNAMRIVGRVSYFMDEVDQMERYDHTILDHLESKLADMESRFGADEKKMRLREIQEKISQYASEFFIRLPKGKPCVNGKFNFDASKPTVYLNDEEAGEYIRFEEIGSDENYLSIHLALAFALQKFFSHRKRPVPSVLILDQVSRPYYSNKNMQNTGEDGENEREDIVIEEDGDSTALRQYFEFIFEEARCNSELQVIVLEHAYLATMEEYKEATKHRWNKKDGEKLIPDNWPTANGEI